MERARHDTVGSVKGLLDTVSVVDINVNVENARVDPQQLQDTENAMVSFDAEIRATYMSLT